MTIEQVHTSSNVPDSNSLCFREPCRCRLQTTLMRSTVVVHCQGPGGAVHHAKDLTEMPIAKDVVELFILEP